VTTDLLPIDAPALQPLANSAEYDELETELKAVFTSVFNAMIRDRERQLNFTGMPHLGDAELMERVLKLNGLAIIRRDDTRTAFLLKAALARNPRRGMLFLKQYLQATWPNVWKVEPLWHPIATANEYPDHVTPRTIIDIGTNVQAVYDPDSMDGLPTIYRTDWQGEQKLYPVARTNLIQNSNLASAGANWTLSNATVTSNSVIAPDGTNTGAKVTRTAAGNDWAAQTETAIAAASKTFTGSVYLLGAGMPGNYTLRLRDSADTQYATQNITLDDTVAWHRVSITAALPATAVGGAKFTVDPTSDTGAAGDAFYMWGAQLEVGVLTGLIQTPVGATKTVTDYTVDANGIATFSDGVSPATPITHFRTSRVRVTLPVTTDNGLGLLEVAKAFRSVLAARLMIELQLSTVFEGIGVTGGLAMSNGASGVMPVLANGTLS
jgi:hypothetical protein